MLRFFSVLQALLTDAPQRDDRGATAVEYGLMVALIAAMIIGGVSLIGINLGGLFTGVAGQL